MTHLPRDPESAPQNLRDWGISVLRTVVPVLWGYVITWVATLSPVISSALEREAVYAAVVAAVTAVWYALFRRIERFIPAWLTRLILGANSAPVYPPAVVIEGHVESIQTDPPPGGTIFHG